MKKKSTEVSVSYYRKPQNMSMEEYQVLLRRQFAQDKSFRIKKLGTQPVYTDYNVFNPDTGNTYKVAIRSKDNSLNFCSCLDFKTSGLGTCKHIEAVMLKIQKQPKLKSILNRGHELPYTSVYLKYSRERLIKIRIGNEKSKEFTLLSKKYFDKDLTLTSYGFDNIEHLIEEAAAIHPSFRCYTDALDFILEERAKKKRIELFENKYGKTHLNGAFDDLIKTRLFPYQKQGIYFAAIAGRSLIADEMGLGKTIQAIATVELMSRELGINGILIVCPTSLKYQWKSEIEKFTQSTVIVIEGNALKREKLYHQESFYKIISYHLVGNDIEILNSLSLDLVILDEAQRIKNWKTKVAGNVKKIRSPYAIVLTGTPLENKIEELYSIIQFINPFRLGALFRFLNEHVVRDDMGKVTGYRNLNKIGEILSDLVIRRTKTSVQIQLPERIDKHLFVPMTPRQSEMHEEYQTIVSRLVNKWKRMGFLLEKDRQKLMIALNCMRMVCDSTFILDQESRNDTKIDELMNILDEVIENATEKVVIFSQWERMTRLVAQELDLRGIRYENLHGAIPSSDRESLFSNFNNNPESRIFLSTDAGGVGLNLQAASLLINLDIPWNPAVLEQRIARIHRLGQKKNVTIINMVSSETIEHRMLNVLKFKSSIAGGVLDKGEDTIFMEEGRFKKFMNEVEKITSPDVPDLFERKEPVTLEEQEEIHVENQELSPLDQPVKGNKEFEPVTAGDDDIPGTTPLMADSESISKPSDLVDLGMRFFSNLSKTLSDPVATKNLISSLVAKDRETGQTYLKIPVENQQVVENALNLLSGFIQSMKK